LDLNGMDFSFSLEMELGYDYWREPRFPFNPSWKSFY
jgi:hypothetical protein